ncbi:MAG: hypothetical protein JSS72_09370 [Armatimonadetes bacterium]|nr:hypothetical protein [Armatimonadota bacterium]
MKGLPRWLVSLRYKEFALFAVVAYLLNTLVWQTYASSEYRISLGLDVILTIAMRLLAAFLILFLPRKHWRSVFANKVVVALYFAIVLGHTLHTFDGASERQKQAAGFVHAAGVANALKVWQDAHGAWPRADQIGSFRTDSDGFVATPSDLQVLPDGEARVHIEAVQGDEVAYSQAWRLVPLSKKPTVNPESKEAPRLDYVP